jgi:hypothetical protein
MKKIKYWAKKNMHKMNVSLKVLAKNYLPFFLPLSGSLLGSVISPSKPA